MLSKALYLDFLIFVFQYFQNFMVIEQVIDFSTIYFIHGYSHSEISLIVLPIIDSSFEQILHGKVLQSLHRKCFSRACLAVGENCNCASVEYQV